MTVNRRRPFSSAVLPAPPPYFPRSDIPRRRSVVARCRGATPAPNVQPGSLFAAGEPKNQSHIDDPVLADMLVRRRRTTDVVKRREIVHEIQRHRAKQQYAVATPRQIYVAPWDGALKNYGSNLGYDWGGRVAAAWLAR